MKVEERALRFDCEGCSLIGVANLPEPAQTRGVLIVVGGPQYRTGSHRHFTLLARSLAEAGIPVMRFDYRGMGDSEGESRSFEDIDQDIHCAIDHFFSIASGLRDVVIWGLCDAASAASFYAWQDKRVSGLVLVNPWIRTEEGMARTYLKHYYFRRLFEPGLWKKIASGKFGYREAAGSLAASIGKLFVRREKNSPALAITGNEAALSLPDRMLDGLNRFDGRILVILAGNDLTANEFKTHAGSSRPWKKLLSTDRVCRRDVRQANHTFARNEWREQVAAWTSEWVRMR